MLKTHKNSGYSKENKKLENIIIEKMDNGERRKK